MFAKVETMKKECIKLFKNEIVNGTVGLYEEHSYNTIMMLENQTIEKVADEICEILKHIDVVEYESDNIALTFRKPNKDDIIESLILDEMQDLMKGTDAYNEEDSRTYIYDRLNTCVKFIRENDYIEEMTITHHESFLFDEDFEIKIFNVSQYDYSIKVMDRIYDITYDCQEWNEIWTEIFKRVGA